MLHLRSCIASHLLSTPISAASSPPACRPFPRITDRFTVEGYLIHTYSLTRPQALKASRKLSHLRSPSKPDVVLAFLTGLSPSSADVAITIAKDPKLVCADVERTLGPKLAGPHFRYTSLVIAHSI